MNACARRCLVALIGGLLCGPVAADDNPYLRIDGAEFRTAVPAAGQQRVTVRAFLLQRHPVTNGEFLAFVGAHPQWRRGAVPSVFADATYLSHWRGPLEPGDNARQPVTRVSWFAATAYCEDQGARLPTWYEWELAAAADGTRRDARADPAWRQQILDWYARPAGGGLPDVEQGAANVYGVHDLHGEVWEWVQDFNGLIGGESSERGDPDQARFCGSGALTLQQKENYAVMMRVAMLSSLHAIDSGRALGFRCARDGAAP